MFFFITTNISNFISFENNSPYFKKTLILKSAEDQFCDFLRFVYNSYNIDNLPFLNETDFNNIFVELPSERSQFALCFLQNSNVKNKLNCELKNIYRYINTP